MLQVNNIGLRFSSRVLFENVNLKFDKGNCYGLIGANGAGKSTFLKILYGEIEPTSGEVILGKDERISVLEQNHNKFNDLTVLETVMRGNTKLYEIIKAKEEVYSRNPFTEADGILAGELEATFADMDGWIAEADAATLLMGLGIETETHHMLMGDLKDSVKVKVLLASALFGEPDILLLDEPTNGLDTYAKLWLEEWLINFKNTVIVVSHDRHFLNNVCTHMVDIDFSKITMFIGNYDFWYESSQLIQKQMRDANKKKEDKIKELQDFIARFSANASKSKQATSRKKLLEKIELDDIKPSNRKYPYINFEMERPIGNEVMELKGINYAHEGKVLLKNVAINVNKGDKIAIVGHNELAKTALFKIIASEITDYTGYFKAGATVKISYFAKDHDNYFQDNKNLRDWLQDYSNVKEEAFVRGFLGRMLFSGEEALKSVKVLSGGEKVRSMLAKIMLEGANVLVMDEPTNHLDIESITALNKGMEEFKGVILFATNDHELIETVANRIIEIKDDGTIIDRYMSYNEYLNLNK